MNGRVCVRQRNRVKPLTHMHTHLFLSLSVMTPYMITWPEASQKMSQTFNLKGWKPVQMCKTLSGKTHHALTNMVTHGSPPPLPWASGDPTQRPPRAAAQQSKTCMYAPWARCWQRGAPAVRAPRCAVNDSRCGKRQSSVWHAQVQRLPSTWVRFLQPGTTRHGAAPTGEMLTAGHFISYPSYTSRGHEEE